MFSLLALNLTENLMFCRSIKYFDNISHVNFHFDSMSHVIFLTYEPESTQSWYVLYSAHMVEKPPFKKMNLIIVSEILNPSIFSMALT